MSDGTAPLTLRERPVLSAKPVCADCGVELAEPFGYCTNCRAAYCLTCGREHFCLPSCPAAGCRAGLCVRLVSGGVLAERWGLPE